MINTRCGRTPSGTQHFTCSIIKRGGVPYRVMTSATCDDSSKALRTLAAAVVPAELVGPRINFVCEESFLLVGVDQCERSITALNTAVHYHLSKNTDDLNPDFDKCAVADTATSTQTTSASSTASTTETTLYWPITVLFNQKGYLRAEYSDAAATYHPHGCAHLTRVLNSIILQCSDTLSSGSGDAGVAYGSISCAHEDNIKSLGDASFLVTDNCDRSVAVVNKLMNGALPRPHSGDLVQCTEHGQLHFTPAIDGSPGWATRSNLLGQVVQLFRQGELYNCEVTTPFTTPSTTVSTSMSTTVTTSASSTATTSMTTTQTTKPHCSGLLDQPDCDSLSAFDCGQVIADVNISLACPAMCNACDTITTTTPPPEPLDTLGCVHFNTTNIVTAGEAQCSDLVEIFSRITSHCFPTELSDKMECKSVFHGDEAVIYLGPGERCTKVSAALNVALGALQRPADFQCVDGFLGVARECAAALDSIRLGAAQIGPPAASTSSAAVCIPGLTGRRITEFHFVRDDDFRAAARDGTLLDPLFIAGLEIYLKTTLGTSTEQILISDVTSVGVVTAMVADWPAKDGKLKAEVVGALRDLVTSSTALRFAFSYNGHTLRTSVESSASNLTDSKVETTATVASVGRSEDESSSDDITTSVLFILLVILVVLSLLVCAVFAFKRRAKRQSPGADIIVAQQSDVNSEDVTVVGVRKEDDDEVITDAMSLPPTSPQLKGTDHGGSDQTVRASGNTGDTELYETTAFSIGGSPQSNIGGVVAKQGQQDTEYSSKGNTIQRNSEQQNPEATGPPQGVKAIEADKEKPSHPPWRNSINATIVLNRLDQNQGFGFGIKWEDSGAMVSVVAAGSVADGQLAVGDKIVSLNQQPLADMSRETAMSTLATSKTAELGIWSNQEHDDSGRSGPDDAGERRTSQNDLQAYGIATERIPSKVTADWVKPRPGSERSSDAPSVSANSAGAVDDSTEEKKWWKSEFSKRSSMFNEG